MISLKKARAEILTLGLIGALAFALLLWFATPRGLGLSPDSVAYLKAAQGLIDGRGFSYFSVQWPPLFSSAIYIFSLPVNEDFVRGARLLNASLYGCTFFLTAALLRYATGNKLNWLIIYFFSAVFCLHPVITHIYFYAFSEALFLPLVLINLLVLFSKTTNQNQTTFTLGIFLSLIGCIATSTRYAGLVLVSLNSVAICLMAAGSSRRKKLILVMLQVIPTAVLLIKWRGHIGIGDTEANQRPLVWHPVTLENIADGLTNVGTWFLPVAHANVSFLSCTSSMATGAIAVCILFFWAARSTWHRYQKNETDSIFALACVSWILSILGGGYLVFLILMRSLFDPNIVFDPRTLSPIFLPSLVLLVSYCSHFPNWRLRTIALLLIALVYLVPLQQIRPWLLISYFNGIELNDKTRLNSNIVKFLRGCPSNALIYADRPWSFNLEFKAMVHWLPTQHFYGSGLIDPHFQAKVRDLPNLAELIVIEDMQSAMEAAVHKMPNFMQIYHSRDGMIWQNAALPADYCSNRP